MRAKAIAKAKDEHRRNKTEEAFWEMMLIHKAGEQIHDCLWEPFKLRLADNTFYTPDCLVIENDGTLTLYEVKGFWRDDARVKIKVAAREFPFIKFIAVQLKKGSWKYEEMN